MSRSYISGLRFQVSGFLVSLVACLMPLSGRAAVEILSATQVRVDGSPAGDIANALRAFPARSGEILAAIDARLKSADDGVRSIQADRDSQVTTLQTQVQQLQTASAQLATEKAAADERVDNMVTATKLLEDSALPPGLRTTLVEARTSKAEKQRAELEAQKAALDAQLAALPATDAAQVIGKR